MKALVTIAGVSGGISSVVYGNLIPKDHPMYGSNFHKLGHYYDWYSKTSPKLTKVTVEKQGYTGTSVFGTICQTCGHVDINRLFTKDELSEHNHSLSEDNKKQYHSWVIYDDFDHFCRRGF